MLNRHHLTRKTKQVLKFFLYSILVVSLIGSYVGLSGRKTPITRLPTEIYENVSFISQAKDNLELDGWFLPASSNKVVLIVHGWGGNRATFIDLAQYLQRQNINVLTFDLRGGTGKNTYGQRESGDVAGAVDWLVNTKAFEATNIALIGNSMGGAAVIDYSANHTVGAVVLLNSVINLKHTKNFFARDYNLIFPNIYAAGVTFVERVIYGVRPINPVDVFNNIQAPILVLHGTDDQKSPVQDVYDLQKNVSNRNQNVTFIIVPNAGHTFFEEKDTSEHSQYSQQIYEFIQKQP